MVLGAVIISVILYVLGRSVKKRPKYTIEQETKDLLNKAGIRPYNILRIEVGHANAVSFEDRLAALNKI